jgi:hypothetical protein
VIGSGLGSVLRENIAIAQKRSVFMKVYSFIHYYGYSFCCYTILCIMKRLDCCLWCIYEHDPRMRMAFRQNCHIVDYIFISRKTQTSPIGHFNGRIQLGRFTGMMPSGRDDATLIR